MKEPTLLLFGGYDGVSFLDDIWELRLSDLTKDHGSEAEVENWRDNCAWRVKRPSTVSKIWDESCNATSLADSVRGCHVDDIVLRSWCEMRSHIDSFENDAAFDDDSVAGRPANCRKPDCSEPTARAWLRAEH